MASYFENLPTEILRCIVSRASSASSLALMQTNSVIHARVEPLLYEHIEWNIERTYTKPTVHQFLEKLLDRPEVGQWVRSFTMVGRVNQKIYSGLSRRTISRLFELASTSFPEQFEDESEEWWQRAYASSSIMLVSLLVLFCPNITHLTPWTGFSDPLHRLIFLGKAIKTIPNLHYLDYATGNTKFPSIPWTHFQLSFIFEIQPLRHLRIQVTEDATPGGHTVPDPTLVKSPQITTLELHSSVLSEESLGRFLTKFPNLKTLKLGLLRETKPNSPDSALAGSFIDCVALGKALLPLERTLENLTITVEYYSTREWHRTNGGPHHTGRDGNPGILHYWGVKDALPSLRSFSKMSYLEIDLALLLGMDIERTGILDQALPRNLKVLKLRSDFAACRSYERSTPQIAGIIEGLFKLPLSQANQVQAVVLQLLESRALRHVEALDKAAKQCRVAGARFAVEKLVG